MVDEAEGVDWADETDETDMTEMALTHERIILF